VFVAWALDAQASGRVQHGESRLIPLGCHLACSVVRDASAAAFLQHRRGMVAGDVIPQLAPAMQKTFPV
jgi:NAD(P)H-hydrate repair Nnr-like enzyme with NAD(P)H-hydrate dehydratase domain